MKKRGKPCLEFRKPGDKDDHQKTASIVKVGDHHGGSGRIYMAHKMIKLRDQYSVAHDKLNDGNISISAGIFKGIIIHVNGYTVPTLNVIREMVAKGGGQIEAYYTSSVTHMVADVLPETKLAKLRKLRHPPKIVRAKWVSDSVVAKKLLPIFPYIVSGLAVQKQQIEYFVSDKQMQMASQKPHAYPSFPEIKIVGISNNSSSAESHFTYPSNDSALGNENEDLNNVNNDGTHEDFYSCKKLLYIDKSSSNLISGEDNSILNQSSEGEIGNVCTEKRPRETSFPTSNNDSAASITRKFEQRCTQQNEIQNEASKSVSEPIKSVAKKELTDSGKRAKVVANSRIFDEEKLYSNSVSCTKNAVNTEVGGKISPKYVKDANTRSSKGDPEFMKSFFKHSRLHHIGHFNARYRKMIGEYMKERDANGGKARYSGPLGTGGMRVILHIDMDCFFVSVMVRNHPELANLPVAVAHLTEKKDSTSEISSCNYAARQKGVHAGMTMSRAMQLCPDMVVLPYDFQAFDEVSDKIYRIFYRAAPVVQAMSCDEAFLELPAGCNPMLVASEVRREILQCTGCASSAGAGSSMLLARIATKRAKPNGQSYLPQDQAKTILADMSVKDLPGIGYKVYEKLKKNGITLCKHVQNSSESQLKNLCGNKTGISLWKYVHGEDIRPVQPYVHRKSLGAEVSWGVRFDEQSDVDRFIEQLCEEVACRLIDQGCKGRTLSLSLKRKQQGAPEPRKYLGHGFCDSFSRSSTLCKPEDNPEVLSSAARGLLLALNCPPKEIRGLGIHMTRLVDAITGMPLLDNDQVQEVTALSSWLQKSSKSKSTPDEIDDRKSEQFSISNPMSSKLDECLSKQCDTFTGTCEKARSSLLDSNTSMSGKRKIIDISDDIATSVDSKHRLSQVTFSQVDPEYISALPEDLRQQVFATLNHTNLQYTKQNHVSKPSISLFPETFSQVDPSVLGALSEEMQIEIRDGLMTKNPLKVKPLATKKISGSMRENQKADKNRNKVKKWQPQISDMIKIHKASEVPEGIDSEVFHSLPLKIRLELADKSNNDKKHNIGNNWDKQPVRDEAKATGGLKSMFRPTYFQDRAAGEKKVEYQKLNADCPTEVRKTLKNWLEKCIANTVGPTDDHISVLYEFITILVTEYRLEEAAICMRSIHNSMYQASQLWMDVYNELEIAVQNFVKGKMNGSRLRIFINKA